MSPALPGCMWGARTQQEADERLDQVPPNPLALPDPISLSHPLSFSVSLSSLLGWLVGSTCLPLCLCVPPCCVSFFRVTSSLFGSLFLSLPLENDRREGESVPQREREK